MSGGTGHANVQQVHNKHETDFTEIILSHHFEKHPRDLRHLDIILKKKYTMAFLSDFQI